MISDEVWDQVREAWFAAIPLQYRFTDKEPRKDCKGRGVQADHNRHLSSAIILSPPPKPLLDQWFAHFERHLTKDQLQAKANRENCGKPGVR